jgi:hypothetical protein
MSAASRRWLISGLLFAAAVGTLAWASVEVGSDACTVANTEVWGATVDEAILLFVSLATASAGASLALSHRPLAIVIVLTLASAGAWFIVSWTVFFVVAFNHCSVWADVRPVG